VRIIIAAPPKTGNSWLRCLFADIYDLEWLRDAPVSSDPAELASWAASGRFPDDAVFHLHYDYSPELVETAAAIPAHLATILRDPYDQFVSGYFFIQAQAEAGKLRRRGDEGGGESIVGKPIDHPDVLAFLAGGFRKNLVKGLAWLQSGRSVVVRYERLHDDPIAELTRATDLISPVARERIVTAVEACEAQTLLKSRKGLAKRIRSATVGDWRNHLSEVHLAIFREQYADLIRALGYEVH